MLHCFARHVRQYLMKSTWWPVFEKMQFLDDITLKQMSDFSNLFRSHLTLNMLVAGNMTAKVIGCSHRHFQHMSFLPSMCRTYHLSWFYERTSVLGIERTLLQHSKVASVGSSSPYSTTCGTHCLWSVTRPSLSASRSETTRSRHFGENWKSSNTGLRHTHADLLWTWSDEYTWLRAGWNRCRNDSRITRWLSAIDGFQSFYMPR